MDNVNATEAASQTVLIPFKITTIYLAVGVLWILLSDKLVELLVPDPGIFTLVAIIKGWCYVVATALMLYVLIRRGAAQIQRSQQALRVTEARYEELVECANSIIMRRDREGRIRFFNRFAQEFFGYTSDEILGKNVIGTIVPEVDSSGRDLRAMIRNIGMPLAHGLIAIKSTTKGLHKLLLNEEAIERDLENNWAVVAEGIQTILRREGYPKPYEALKALTRTNRHITKESISDFIDTLEVNEEIKKELKAISPKNYTGI